MYCFLQLSSKKRKSQKQNRTCPSEAAAPKRTDEIFADQLTALHAIGKKSTGRISTPRHFYCKQTFAVIRIMKRSLVGAF